MLWASQRDADLTTPHASVAARDRRSTWRPSWRHAHVRTVEIVDSRRGHRVQRRGEGRSDDGGNDEPDDAVRQRGDNEARQDLVSAADGGGKGVC